MRTGIDAAKEIRIGRNLRNWTQEQLAKEANIGRSSIVRWETGGNISNEKLQRIRDAFTDNPVAEHNDEDDVPEAIQDPKGKRGRPSKVDVQASEEGDAAQTGFLLNDSNYMEKEILRAIRMAHNSGDPLWTIVILPHETEGVDIRVCARPKGSRNHE